MKFVIDRKTWLRGEEGSASRLYRTRDSKKCCLGFYGEACGLSKEEMEDVESPACLVRRDLIKKGTVPDWLLAEYEFVDDSPDCERLMVVNDDPRLSDQGREDTIKAIFASYGVEVEFIN